MYCKMSTSADICLFNTLIRFYELMKHSMTALHCELEKTGNDNLRLQ